MLAHTIRCRDEFSTVISDLHKHNYYQHRPTAIFRTHRFRARKQPTIFIIFHSAFIFQCLLWRCVLLSEPHVHVCIKQCTGTSSISRTLTTLSTYICNRSMRIVLCLCPKHLLRNFGRNSIVKLTIGIAKVVEKDHRFGTLVFERVTRGRWDVITKASAPMESTLTLDVSTLFRWNKTENGDITLIDNLCLWFSELVGTGNFCRRLAP